MAQKKGLGKILGLEIFDGPGNITKHNFSKEAKEIVASEEREISLYQRYKEFVSYGFYIARKNKQ